MRNQLEEIDFTLDQLLENARMLHSIENDPNFSLEKKALEDIQESLYHRLLSLKVSDAQKEEIKQNLNKGKESIFFVPRHRARKFRMKQVLEQH